MGKDKDPEAWDPNDPDYKRGQRKGEQAKREQDGRDSANKNGGSSRK